MVRTLLYFGSFNPIHRGHTAIARYAIEHGFCDELWFVVSPRNPLKNQEGLAPESDRLKMVEIAVCDDLKCLPVRVSDIEFGLPRPSYTIDTLDLLRSRCPDNEFSILIGADIIPGIKRWKDSERLLADYRFYVYPREGFALDAACHNIVCLEDAPVFRYSSTDVRNEIRAGGDLIGMVSPGVAEYIAENRLWK